MRKFIAIQGTKFARVQNVEVAVQETEMSLKAAEILKRGSNATSTKKTKSFSSQVKREFRAASRWKNDGALWD